MQLPALPAIIFDLDRTLLDTERPYRAAFLSPRWADMAAGMATILIPDLLPSTRELRARGLAVLPDLRAPADALEPRQRSYACVWGEVSEPASI